MLLQKETNVITRRQCCKNQKDENTIFYCLPGNQLTIGSIHSGVKAYSEHYPLQRLHKEAKKTCQNVKLYQFLYSHDYVQIQLLFEIRRFSEVKGAVKTWYYHVSWLTKIPGGHPLVCGFTRGFAMCLHIRSE